MSGLTKRGSQSNQPSPSKRGWGEGFLATRRPTPPAPLPKGEGRRNRNRLVVFLLVCAITILTSGYLIPRAEPVSNSNEPSLQQQMQFPADLDYSKFQHNTAYHARLPCLLCHRRDSNESIPKRPGADNHLPCAGCHSQQFSNADSPLCTVCHTDVKSGAMKPFPRLRSFNMKFDHARHMGSVNCASCHRPAGGGVALSIPSGFNAHTTCFRCHTNGAQSGGRDISSCGTCHQLGGYSRTPQFAQAFRVGFSHGEHDQVTCNGCHEVRGGMAQRRQVTAPQPLNHHASGRGRSCMTCHDGTRAFGGDDFTVCKRCHTGTTWRF